MLSHRFGNKRIDCAEDLASKIQKFSYSKTELEFTEYFEISLGTFAKSELKF